MLLYLQQQQPAPTTPSHYTGINALLGALHSERVRSGARQRWEDSDGDDDDDDEDL